MSASPRARPAAVPLNERLIVALDVPDLEAAKALVERLGDSVSFYKIGLELATTRDYFRLLEWLLGRDKRVFADLKLYDIPATVGAAVRQMSRSGASFLTVHGDRAILEAAAANKGETLRILAVTVLTSVDAGDLARSGIGLDVATLAMRRAEDALASGCDGVIASPLEAAALRKRLGPDALIVTPGIRPRGHGGGDDQKRVATAFDAFRDGADHVVVGRPIRAAPDPRAAALEIRKEIAAALG